MIFPAALMPNQAFIPQLQQSSTGAVQIDTNQNQMSSSPRRQLREVGGLHSPLANYGVNINSMTVARFIPEPAASTFVAKTPLGKKLVAIRQRAIASGLRLLTEEEIRLEVELRRGENRG